MRFQLPRIPLKVLRGEKDEEDIRDKYHERFQVPGTSSEESENNRDIDDGSRRSNLSRDYITTDIGEVSEEGMARYLGGSIESTNNDPPENQSHPNNIDNAPEYPHNAPECTSGIQEYPPSVPECDTTESINLEAADNDADTGSFSNRSSLRRDEVTETNDDNNDNTDVYSNTSSLQRHGTSDISDNNTNGDDNKKSGDHDNDNGSQGEVRHLDNDDTGINTGNQAIGSVSHEAVELQDLTQVNKPPKS